MKTVPRIIRKSQASFQYWSLYLWTKLRLEYRFFSLRRQLKSSGIQRYCIVLRDAGLGDQLLNANVSAKISEKLGLVFSGIDERSLTNHKSHREGYLQIYQYIGLAKIKNTDLQTLIEIPNTDLKQLTCFLRYIEEMIKDMEPGKAKTIGFQTPVPICHRSLRYLKNRNGTFLENQFSRQLKRYCKPSLLDSERSVHKILFHIRLGDVANLELLPDKIFIPWCFANENEGFIEALRQPSHYRYDHLLDFATLVKSLRSKMGNKIELNVISDGFDTSFDYIFDQQKILDYLESYDLRYDKFMVTDLKSSYRDEFHHRFAEADAVIYGEGAEASIRAIDLIIDSDVIVSSSGHFAMGVMNNLGNRKQTFFSPKITYLAAQRKNARQNVATQLLSDSADENLKKIMQALEPSIQ